jgi:type I restriction enzyme, S subunit
VGTVAPLKEFELLDICDFYSGKAHEQHITDNGKFKVINSKFVATEGEVYKTCSESFMTAKKNDITMVMSDLPNGRALAKCFLVDEDDKYAVNQRVCILRAKSFDPKYLFYVLNRHDYFLSFNDGVSQTHLLNHVFEKCKIVISDDISEQKAIAEALSDIDELIGKTRELINKYSHLREATYSNIYGNSSFWKIQSLSDFCGGDELIVDGPFGSNLKNEHYVYSGIPVLSGGNISNNAWNFTNLRFISESKAKELYRCNVVVGDILTVKIGSVGYSTIVTDLGKHDFAIIPANLLRLRVNNSNSSARFLKLALQEPNNVERLKELATSTAQPALNLRKFRAFEIRVPNINDQIRIVGVFEDQEKHLEELRNELRKYEWLKLGMMNDLLTGKVRLV